MEFKRGDTFDFTGEVSVQYGLDGAEANLTGWSASSQLRDAGDSMIADLRVEIVDGPARLIRLFFDGETSDWPLGCAQTDIRFVTPDGTIVSTGVSEFEIVQRPTRPGDA